MKTITVEVNGVKYDLQKLPTRAALQLRSRCKDKGGNPNEIKLYDELLENVVIKPKIKLDDFEDVADLEDLMKEVITFQYGRKEGK